MKNNKGFTLIEILAVIVVLAILIIIIVPNILKMYTKARKEVFLTSVKNIGKEAERQYLSGYIKGTPPTLINSKDNTKLDMEGNELDYCIVLDANGKVTSMKVSNGKWIANVEGTSFESLKTEDLEEGNLDEYTCGSSIVDNSPEPIYCTFEGDLVQGAEYINGQYTYRYMQEILNGIVWQNITEDGWGVTLTDKESTAPVTTPFCTYINNKPVVSTSFMFYNSKATTLDLSTFNTKNVINMSCMFQQSQAMILDLSTFNTSNVINMKFMFRNLQAITLDLSSFDTSKVEDMSYMFNDSQATILDLSSFNTGKVTTMRDMFNGSQATTINLSSFNTSNVITMNNMFRNSQATTLDVSSFDTNKVIDMGNMFYGSKATILDLSSYDTSKVTNMSSMFNNAVSTTGYARTQADADKFNASSNKPAGLNFIVKP